MRHLGAFGGKRFVVEGFGRFGVERERELVTPICESCPLDSCVCTEL
jgi:hypothetical protein